MRLKATRQWFDRRAAARVVAVVCAAVLMVLLVNSAPSGDDATAAGNSVAESDDAHMWFAPIDGDLSPVESADPVGIAGLSVEAMTIGRHVDLPFPLGSASLHYAGEVAADGHATAALTLYDDLHIPVAPSTVLTYLIRPDNAASAHMRVTTLRISAGGAAVEEASQTSTLDVGQWNLVTIDVGDATGDVIDTIALSADIPHAAAGATLSGDIANLTVAPAVVNGETAWNSDAVTADSAVHSFDLTAAEQARTRGLYGVVKVADSAKVFINGVQVAWWSGGPGNRIVSIPGSLLRVGRNTLAVEAPEQGEPDEIGGTLKILVRLGSYLPASYTDTELDYHYPSDHRPESDDGEDYRTSLLTGFNALMADDPATVAPSTVVPHDEKLRAANDLTEVAINTTASGADRERATADADGEQYLDLADGLGPLDAPYRMALKKHELPKTVELLGNRAEDYIGHGTSDIKDVYRYPRPFVRLGFTRDGGRLIAASNRSIYDDIRGSWSFPSGHTIHGYTAGILLATLLPEQGPQVLARTSDYANHRVVLGVHYPMDVIGGRIVGSVVPVSRWSDMQFRPLLLQAKAELDTVLAAECGTVTIAQCVSKPHAAPQYLPTDDAVALFTKRLTYGFDQVGDTNAALILPDGAENLLITALPDMSVAERRGVLRATALPSGYPLDLSGAGGAGWQRLNLAAAMAAG